MSQITSFLIVLAASLYILAGLLTGLRLFRNHNRSHIPRHLALGLGFAAIALHAWLLYGSILGGTGLNLSFFTAASLTAWLVATLLLVSALSKPIESLGIFILPIAAIVLLIDMQYPQQHLFAADAHWALGVHIITSILAYALLTLASTQAMLFAMQNHQLRKHHPGGFIRALPPLQTMEALLFEMIAVGFILLSIALLSGFIYLDDMFAQHVAHKTVLSILAWITFAVLLWGRYAFGWRGHIAVRWTLIGFVTLMLAYFGSKAILELLLQR
jgi:ABC-type uncharacterized transport system permease subunit